MIKNIPHGTVELGKKYFSLIWYGSVFALLLWRSLYLFYPGYLYKQHGQYLTALGQRAYSDIDPANYAFMFKILMNIFGHYTSLLIFDEIMLWLGLILVVTSLVKNHIIATLLILLVGFGPYYFPYILYYYKDIPFGASLLLSFGLIIKARDWNKPFLIFIAIYFLYFSASLRFNGFIAIFPICFSIAYILRDKVTFSNRSTNLAAIAIFILILSSAWLTNKVLTRRSEPTFSFQRPVIFDLFGMSHHAGQMLLPQQYEEKYEDTQHIGMLIRGFSSKTIDSISKRDDVHLHWVETKEEFSALVNAWISSISRHPFSYLKHRLNYFSHYLVPEGDRRDINGSSYPQRITELYESRKISKIESNILNWYYVSGYRSIEKKPIVFLILYLLIIMWFHWRKWKDDPVVIGFALSGFLYLVTHFFIGIHYAFKYIWWSVISLPPIIIYVCTQLKFRIRQ